jgi:hypothetical protein
MTYQRLHGSVKSMSVVSSELGVGSLERWVTVGLGLLDSVSSVRWALESLLILEVGRTRSCEPSSTGCAETSSWTL